MANLGLWKTSGHFDFYKENMFQAMEVENEEYQIKPMNCPFHCLIYKVCFCSFCHSANNTSTSSECRYGSPPLVNDHRALLLL